MECTMTPRKNGSAPARTERMERANTYTPRVDIFETDEEVTLYADLPGVKQEDLELKVENSELTLHGKVTRHEPGKALLREYGSGDFWRVFRISSDIDVSKIGATLKDGVLQVKLPKAERVRPRKIAIQGA